MEKLVDKFIKERKESRNGGWQMEIEHLMREIFVHRKKDVLEINFENYVRGIESISDDIYAPSNLKEQVIKFIKENGFMVQQRKFYGVTESGVYLVSLF